MPADPIEYRVVKHLQAALQAIAIADGYHFDVAGSAVRLDADVAVEQLIKPDGPRPFVLLDVPADRWSYPEKPNGVRLVLPIEIHWVSDAAPTDDDSLMKTFFQGCADVEAAIAADITRGGLAVDTRIVRRTFDPIGAEVRAIIETEVVIRRTYGAANG